MQGFDFEKLAHLAATDLKAFETERRKLLLEAVARAPAAYQAKGMSLVEELCAEPMSSPLERIANSQNRMMQSMLSMQTQLTKLLQVVAPTENPEQPGSAELFTALKPKQD